MAAENRRLAMHILEMAGIAPQTGLKTITV
jgi:hypothetical protein